MVLSHLPTHSARLSPMNADHEGTRATKLAESTRRFSRLSEYDSLLTGITSDRRAFHFGKLTLETALLGYIPESMKPRYEPLALDRPKA